DASHRPAARRSAGDVRRLPPLPTVDAASSRAASAPPPAESVAPLLEPVEAEVYEALCLGLRDYVEKNGFAHVVLGLSGGIDSALVACVAADARGAERVSVAIMPSPYSSVSTQQDARDLAAALGVEVLELPIADVMGSYEALLAGPFAGHRPGIAEENLQARIR